MVDISPKMQTALLLTMLGAAGTALGGLLIIVQPEMNFKTLGMFQGLAAGLMLCISIFDLLPESVEELSFAEAHIWFYLGVIFFAAIAAAVPDDPPLLNINPPSTQKAKAEDKLRTETDEQKGAKLERRKVLISGVITALGIAIHNFPEGVAVMLASLKSTAIGLSLAGAITLHNIPEGIAVALPVYFATGSRVKGFMWAFISGLAEPLAVIALGIFFPLNLAKTAIDKMLAAVAGIMAFLAIHELLPLSIKHAGQHLAVATFFGGMAIMSMNLWLLDHWVLQKN